MAPTTTEWIVCQCQNTRMAFGSHAEGEPAKGGWESGTSMQKGSDAVKTVAADDLPAMLPIRGSDVFRSKRLIGALLPL
jgi:hypothetical protein